MQTKISENVQEDFLRRIGDLIYTINGVLLKGERTAQRLEENLKTIERLETKTDMLNSVLTKILEERVKDDNRRKRKRKKYAFITRKDKN